MNTNEKFTIGTPVMCWNGDNMESAKMRMLLALLPEKFSVTFPGYDGIDRIEYFDHICNLQEYRRYISTPGYPSVKNQKSDLFFGSPTYHLLLSKSV